MIKEIFKKILRNKSENKEREYKDYILPKIKNIHETIKTKKDISFLHYGHLGDIINSLPVIKELSKDKNCSLYIQINKLMPKHAISKEHPSGSVYLTENATNKLLPLLKEQKYINKVEIYKNQKIDVDLNFFRELPINFNLDSIRWYFHLTGDFPDLSKNYINVEPHEKFKDHIVIVRSLRRQNKHIDYSFLSSYEKIVFVGLEQEFNDLQKKVQSLKFYDCKDFLELAMIIKNAKLFIGNLSFGYALAEAIKVPRLLESGPNFPLVYPNGNNAFDFYFQTHFEGLIKKIMHSKQS